MKEKICIYHGNCADGFTSAWIMYSYYKFKFDYTVKFIPASYGDEKESKEWIKANLKHKDVYFVDFSFKEEYMRYTCDVADYVTVLDHHKTAEQYIKPMIDEGLLSGVFNMNKSGATITWDWFFGDKEQPTLVKYVEDRDLWKFELPHSKEISQYIFSFNYTFDNWDYISNELEVRFLSCITQGEAIERKHMKDTRELVATTAIQNVKFNKFGLDTFTVANLPYIYSSDGCHLIAQEYQDEFQKPVGITYFQNKDGKYVFSLRSIGDIDVSEMAKLYGGGGHKNAAGFVVGGIPFYKE